MSLQTQVCLVGKSRTYLPSAEVWMDEQRTRYLHSRQGHPQSPPPPQPAAHDAGRQDSHRTFDAGAESMPEGLAAERGTGAPATGLWVPGFCPREKAERVRNCAALPRDFVDRVVLQVASLLLDGKKFNTGDSEDGALKTWNGGGKPAPRRQARGPCGLRAFCRSARSVGVTTVHSRHSGEDGRGQGCSCLILRNNTDGWVTESEQSHSLECKYIAFILCNP